MKRIILISIVLIFNFLFVFISCTADNRTEEVYLVEKKEDKSDLLLRGGSRERDNPLGIEEVNIYDCSSTRAPENEIFQFYVEWKEGLTEEEKHLIRLEKTFTGYLVCVDLDYCPAKPNAELWTVRGNCPPEQECRPKVQIPTIPDLRIVSTLNDNIAANCGS